MKPNLAKRLAIVVTIIAVLLFLRFRDNDSGGENGAGNRTPSERVASGNLNPQDNRSPGRHKPRRERAEGGEISAADLERWLASLKGDSRTIAEAYATVGLLNNDPELIRKALEMDPNNPHLLYIGTTGGDFSDQERLALAERFFKQDTDNALSAYIYASHLFKSGEAEKALGILGIGSERQRTDDYNARMGLMFEKAYVGAGAPRDTAKLGSIFNLSLPYLSDLSSLATTLNDSAKTRTPAEAAKIHALSATMAKRIRDQTGSGTLINHLVGMAMEEKTLAGLPGDSPSPYAGLTVAEARESIAIERENLRQAMQDLPDLETLLPGNPELTNGYVDRFRTDGEAEALKWLREQTDSANR